MCNYYETTDEEAFATLFGPMHQQLPLFRHGVGPFDKGYFVRPVEAGGLQVFEGQWGMIRPGATQRWECKLRNGAKTKEPMLTNNCRHDSILPPAGKRPKPTFAKAWASGQRCLIPAQRYREPNWERGRNIWWDLARADGLPWAIAGLWSEWTDHETGEVVPNFTMITVNCDHHPLLKRLHKPDPKLPPHEQDKRSVVQLARSDWDTWLHGSPEAAAALLVPAPVEVFDEGVAKKTDAILAAIARGDQVPAKINLDDYTLEALGGASYGATAQGELPGF